MKVVAITGGIGAGKSTVRGLFQELGAIGIDADQLARQAVQPGSEGAQLLREAFGSEFFDSEGHLDRRLMASKVFNNHEARLTLEKILHPLIRAAENKLLKSIECEKPGAVVVLEIPLLAEGGRSEKYDGVVLVAAPKNVRISRLVESGKYSSNEAASRMASQAGDRAREKMATWTVDNGGALEHTIEQVEMIYRTITGA